MCVLLNNIKPRKIYIRGKEIATYIYYIPGWIVTVLQSLFRTPGTASIVDQHIIRTVRLHNAHLSVAHDGAVL